MGELSDLCLPREKPRKGSTKQPLASVLRKGWEWGRFVWAGRDEVWQLCGSLVTGAPGWVGMTVAGR